MILFHLTCRDNLDDIACRGLLVEKFRPNLGMPEGIYLFDYDDQKVRYKFHHCHIGHIEVNLSCINRDYLKEYRGEIKEGRRSEEKPDFYYYTQDIKPEYLRLVVFGKWGLEQTLFRSFMRNPFSK